MTILSRGELIKRLRDRDLVVSPILCEEQIGAASIDLRMGNVVLMVRARGASHVDPAEMKTAKSGTAHALPQPIARPYPLMSTSS